MINETIKKIMTDLFGDNILDNKSLNAVIPEISEDNRKRIIVISALATIAMALMIGSSFIYDSLVKNRNIYIILGVYSAVIYLASVRFKSRIAVLLELYSFVALLLAFGILLGTVIEPNETSVSFPVLLVAVPLMFTEHPHRMNTSTILAVVVYCIAAVKTQTPTMVQYNLTNVIPYGLLSIVLCSFTMRVKLSRYELQYRYSAINAELENTNHLLEEARVAAEKSNKAKTEFLFNMSHDIRTPMNAIVGYTRLLEKEANNPEKVLDYQKKLEKSGNLLLDLINGVLDMSRIESGKLELNEEYFHTGSFLQDIADVFESTIEEKHLTVVCTENVQAEHIMLDITKTHEVISNLIGNAVKYTPDGGTITATTTELPCDREGYVLFETVIEDNGIGMSEEFLPHIFDSFAREKNTTTSKIAGTGLGLSIVKLLVDAMGGSISVESQLGVGSKFTMLLYHRIADEKYYKKAENDSLENNSVSLAGKRILLAEDNDLNAEIAMEILGEIGLDVERASDGVECLDMIKKAEPDYYDLILMDIQMPKMDGYEASKNIRKTDLSIPIIAMTANAFDEDKTNAINAGMNDHLAKPIDIDDLKKKLSLYL